MSDTQTDDAGDHESDRAGRVHRYPDRLTYLLGLLSATIFSIPIIVALFGGTIAPTGWLYCWIPACIPAGIAFVTLRYSVVVTSNKLVIRNGSTRREVLLSNVEKTEIVSTRNGPQLRVTLTDGKELRFNGMLTDFDDLASRLAVGRRAANP
jgi:hypothetical protein